MQVPIQVALCSMTCMTLFQTRWATVCLPDLHVQQAEETCGSRGGCPVAEILKSKSLTSKTLASTSVTSRFSMAGFVGIPPYTRHPRPPPNPPLYQGGRPAQLV
jgi:hypothetical protein